MILTGLQVGVTVANRPVSARFFVPGPGIASLLAGFLLLPSEPVACHLEQRARLTPLMPPKTKSEKKRKKKRPSWGGGGAGSGRKGWGGVTAEQTA